MAILSYSQLARAVDRLVEHYSFLCAPATDGTVPAEAVVACLVSTAVDETILEIALCKLGLTPLLLSTNNSAAAVAHLIAETKSQCLIYSQKYADIAETAKAWLGEDGVKVDLVEEKRFPLWGEGGIDEWNGERLNARLTPENEAQRTAVILHSSGSVSQRRSLGGKSSPSS